MSEHRHDPRTTSEPPGPGRANADAASPLAPGHRTLIMDLPPAPVQMRVARDAEGGAPSAEVVHGAAQQGISGSGGALPFRDSIQRAFGRYDVSGVQAHTGAAAAEGARGMGADAYATGNAVAFGKSPDLHTAAHEAAHVVQQRAGVQLAGGVGSAGDHHEQHADAVADRVVAGGSAEGLLDRYATGGAAAPTTGVQRKITRDTGDDGEPYVYPSTYKQLQKTSDADAKTAADAVINKAATALAADVPAPTRADIEKAWSKIASPKKAGTFDVKSAELVAEVVKSVRASRRSAAGAAARNDDARQLTQPLVAANPNLKFTGGARNPLVTSKNMATFGPPAKDADSKVKRTQTHMSTVVLHEMGEGEEAQSSIATDQSSAIISTNKNSTNTKLAAQVKDKDDLATLSAKVATERGLGNMARKDAMNDRIVRHAMKLFARLDQYLKDGSAVRVPASVEPKLDGRHAEIRIIQSAQFDDDTHHAPSGTKYPCAGCYLHFVDEGKTIGVEMGPMWVTAPALSTQLAGKKLSDLDDVDAVAKEIVDQYAAAIGQGAKMGMGKPKTGKPTTAVNADSDSEYDSDEFDDLRTRMLDHIQGGTTSGKGKGPAVAPPPTASSSTQFPTAPPSTSSGSITSDTSIDGDSAGFSAGATQQSLGSQVHGFNALALSDVDELDQIDELSEHDEPMATQPGTSSKRKRGAEPDDAEHGGKRRHPAGTPQRPGVGRRTANRRGPGPSHASTSAMLAPPPTDTTDTTDTTDYDGDSEMS